MRSAQRRDARQPARVTRGGRSDSTRSRARSSPSLPSRSILSSGFCWRPARPGLLPTRRRTTSCAGPCSCRSSAGCFPTGVSRRLRSRQIGSGLRSETGTGPAGSTEVTCARPSRVCASARRSSTSHSISAVDRLLTVAKSGPAVVWDVASRRRVASLGGAPTRASFSPDGSLVLTVEDRRGPHLAGERRRTCGVAAAGGDGSRRVLHSARGRGRRRRRWIVRTFKTSGGGALVVVDHGARVTTVAVTPDAQQLVTGGADSVVRVWALREHGRPLHALRGHRGNVTSLALVPGWPVLVSTSTGGFAREWDLRDGQSLHELIGHTNRVTGAALDAKGSHVLTWSTDGTARVWTLDDGKLIASLAAGHKPVTNGAFGPGGIVVHDWGRRARAALAAAARAEAQCGRTCPATGTSRRVHPGRTQGRRGHRSGARRLRQPRQAPCSPAGRPEYGRSRSATTASGSRMRRVAAFSSGELPTAAWSCPTFLLPRPPAPSRSRPMAADSTVADAPGTVRSCPLDGAGCTSSSSPALGQAPASRQLCRGAHLRRQFPWGPAVLWPQCQWCPALRRGDRACGLGAPCWLRQVGPPAGDHGLGRGVHVWDAAAGAVTDLTGQFAIVSGAAFSPDAAGWSPRGRGVPGSGTRRAAAAALPRRARRKTARRDIRRCRSPDRDCRGRRDDPGLRLRVCGGVLRSCCASRMPGSRLPVVGCQPRTRTRLGIR